MFEAAEDRAGITASREPGTCSMNGPGAGWITLARQERLRGEDPLSVWAVLAEGVLHQRAGGPAVMRSQSEHLLDLARLPHITIDDATPATGLRRPPAHGPAAENPLWHGHVGLPQSDNPDDIVMSHPIGTEWCRKSAATCSPTAPSPACAGWISP
ncbi:Scr1 family TA system antitoxin-like transcriptional regulator [Streptomyces sp. YIM 98790]|uniref:Scr1 family TA system antitoxin-like transcriptional regulator n=1 Tax=Streptomyces sp. YIM 98790 TaxID=2689077 RepID=UPI00140AF439|nr:Scr1 family TA system antitoxin-like transcriptional regulator [Streptomyces sp. YIM 98790]